MLLFFTLMFILVSYFCFLTPPDLYYFYYPERIAFIVVNIKS